MRRARIGVQASKASSLLKERKNVSLYGEQCSYAKGRDCCPAEHRPVRYHPDFSWPNRRRSADRCAMQSGRGYRQAAVRDERRGDQGPLRLLAAAASLQVRRLGRGISCRAVQGNSLPALPILRRHRAQWSLYSELNRVAGELGQRIVQDSPEYEKA